MLPPAAPAALRDPRGILCLRPILPRTASFSSENRIKSVTGGGADWRPCCGILSPRSRNPRISQRGKEQHIFQVETYVLFVFAPPVLLLWMVLLGEMLLLLEWMGCSAAGEDVGQGGELVLLVHLLQVDGDVDLCVLPFSPRFPLLIFAICSF